MCRYTLDKASIQESVISLQFSAASLETGNVYFYGKQLNKARCQPE